MNFRSNPTWIKTGVAVVFIASVVMVIMGTQIGQAEKQVESGWVEVFTESFDSLDSATWTITETTSTGYMWGVTSYISDTLTDSGLWAVGGGTQGSLLNWETDSYPEQVLETLAIAGPFSPTQTLLDVRLSFEFLNKVSDSDDVFSVFISYDGTTPVSGTETILPMDVTNWQALSWTKADVEDRPIWIGLRFTNDGADVDTGPVIDNLILEFKYHSKIYIPLVAQQPTLMPTPSPTPAPVYFEDFTDPTSGWFTGDVWRNNWRDRDGDGESEWRWEIVGVISYISDHYQIYIPLSYHNYSDSGVDTWMVWPAERAPMPSEFYIAPNELPENYCVEAKARFDKVSDINWIQHWGVVFGANADGTELYTMQVNFNDDFAILKYENYEYPGDREKGDRPGKNIEVPVLYWSGYHEGINRWDYNTIKVVVKGDQVVAYVNGYRLDHFADVIPGTYHVPDMPRAWVGVIGGSWETTPVAIQYDYFKFMTDVESCPELGE